MDLSFLASTYGEKQGENFCDEWSQNASFCEMVCCADDCILIEYVLIFADAEDSVVLFESKSVTCV